MLAQLVAYLTCSLPRRLRKFPRSLVSLLGTKRLSIKKKCFLVKLEHVGIVVSKNKCEARVDLNLGSCVFASVQHTKTSIAKTMNVEQKKLIL